MPPNTPAQDAPGVGRWAELLFSEAQSTLERARKSKQPAAIAAAERHLRDMEEFRRTHTLTVKATSVRLFPKTSFMNPLPAVLYRGEPVHVLKRQGDCVYIEARNKSGWVKKGQPDLRSFPPGIAELLRTRWQARRNFRVSHPLSPS